MPRAYRKKRVRVIDPPSKAFSTQEPGDMSPEELWQAYGRWCWMVANKFHRRYRTLMEVQHDGRELLGVAFEAMQRSAKTYDSTKGKSFMSYSYQPMMSRIMRFIDRNYFQGVGKSYQKDGVKRKVRVYGVDEYAIANAWQNTAGDEVSESTRRITRIYTKSAQTYNRDHASPEYGMNPEELAIFREEMREVEEVLERRIPAHRREPVRDVLFDQRTWREAAVGQGCSDKNLQILMYPVRKALIRKKTLRPAA